jgi:UDP-glucose 4-epimerase
MNIAIVGSEGFIGKALVNKLLIKGSANVFRFGNNLLPNVDNYQKLNYSDNLLLEKQFKNIDTVVYLASSSIPSTSWHDPLGEIHKNLEPFVSFLELISTKTNVKKIILASSAGTIYGNSVEKLHEESLKNPVSPHGIIKLTSEYYLQYYASKYNFDFTILRISNVFGPGQNTNKGLGVINTFIENIVSNKPIKVYGNGEAVRNYLFISDLTQVLDYFIFKKELDKQIYNVASNDHFSIKEIINSLYTLNLNFDVDYFEDRKSDVNKILIDNNKLKNEILNIYFTPFEDAIQKTFNYIINNENK